MRDYERHEIPQAVPQGIFSTRNTNEEKTEAMSDQNPARDYDKESLKFFIQRAQMGSYSPLTLQEIKAELKRRDETISKEQATMEKREHWNGHVYIVLDDNSTIRHAPDCPCQRQQKQQGDTMVLGKLLDNMFECWT
jgi:hypothetical protein